MLLLDETELAVLRRIYEEVKPFLSPAGIKAIEDNGVYTWFEDADEWGTPLINNGPCAYITMKDGMASCGIEQAWKAGATDFRKPISCQLYPIRVVKNEAAN